MRLMQPQPEGSKQVSNPIVKMVLRDEELAVKGSGLGTYTNNSPQHFGACTRTLGP